MRPSSSLLKTTASLLLGTMTAWALLAYLPDPAWAFFPPHAPILSFSPAAGFNGTDAIDPDTAPVGSQLTFSVVYTHPDNHPPVIASIFQVRNPFVPTALAHDDEGAEEAITMFVNNAPGHPFYAAELKLHRDTTPDPAFPLFHDGNYINGEQFILMVPAGFPNAATYRYYFQATDGEHWRYFGAPWQGTPFTFTLTPALPSNHAPILSYSQDSGYLTDGVNPDKGELNSPFAFRIVYRDQDNDAPSQMRLVIERENATTATFDPYLENALSPTDPRDTTYADGKGYERTVSFPQGIHYRYHFEASDGEESVRLPSSDHLTFTAGHSSIAFIPGIQASRLYREQTFENQLWEPNAPLDVDALNMNEDGTSEDSDIYTRDVIDETNLVLPDDPTGLVLSFNVYKNFMTSLDEEVSSRNIAAWKALPYDWRLPFEDVIKGGVETGNGNISYLTPVTDTPYMIQQMESLAANSANGKVSIVTHSMGGLVAKTLLIELERLKAEEANDLIDHIDRLIMVAPPQLGTPKAIASLLHGDEQSLPPRKFGIPLDVIVSQEAARRLGENMVSAYSLLPSSHYFEVVDTDAQPLIEFAPELDRITGMRNLAGQNVSNEAELRQFLTGNLNGWTREQAAADTDVPNVLLSGLLDKAKASHDAIDTWTPPANIDVYQVAGWGADTIRGIRYDDCDTPFCADTINTLDRELFETQEGDGTVVVASATAMNTKTLYLDLYEYNRKEVINPLVNRNHADIFEAESVRDLISRIVHGTYDDDNLPQYLSLVKPEPTDDDKRLRIRGLSPISINVYDIAGNHTGPVPNSNSKFFEAQIPNSYYYKIGEKTYLGLDTKDQYRIEIDGLALGSFTLAIDEVFNDEVVDSTAFTDIPVTPDTKASLTTQTVGTTSSLSLDVEGDGRPDVTVSPSETPNPKASLKALRQVVSTLAIQKGVKNAIIKQIEAAELALNKGFPKVADGILKGIVKQLQNYPPRLIASSDAQALIQIIETIRVSIV